MNKLYYTNINVNEKPFNGETILLKSIDNIWYQGRYKTQFECEGKIIKFDPFTSRQIDADFHDNDINFRNDYLTHWAELPT